MQGISENSQDLTLETKASSVPSQTPSSNFLLSLREVEIPTFQVIDCLLQFGNCPLCKLSSGLSLGKKRVTTLPQMSLSKRTWLGVVTLTSFSLSDRSLISSSYLSSFSEYFSDAASSDFRLLVTFLSSSSRSPHFLQ